MAWRSSGTNNEEMVNNLKKFRVIRSGVVERAFRNVDRKHFLPPGLVDSAHSDQPLKAGNIHISAPHIYGTVLEALDFEANSCQSFLNIGSGTGYLSCLVAEILGRKGLNYGVEIHQDVVDHSESSIDKWLRDKRQSQSLRRNSDNSDKTAHFEIVQGNGLHIVSTEGESVVGFDRIYVGAALDSADLPKVTQLLAPGGILVAPVDDELVKITCIEHIKTVAEPKECAKKRRNENRVVSFHEHGTEPQFSRQVISGVRFAPLLDLPAVKTVLPARIWSPVIQQYYSETFQKATFQLLMCSNAHVQQLPTKPEKRINQAAILPRVLWLEILSYTHRRWFDPSLDEVQYLKKLVAEEQLKAAKVQQAQVEAENRCRTLERERDLYRILARKWESRVTMLLQQQRESGSPLTITRESASMEEAAGRFGLGAAFQQFMATGLEETPSMQLLLSMEQDQSSDDEAFSDSELQEGSRVASLQDIERNQLSAVGSRTWGEQDDDEEMLADHSSIGSNNSGDVLPSLSRSRFSFDANLQPRSVSMGHESEI